MALSQSAIYTLALESGLTPARAKVAAAIAMAESGGDPNAHNSKPPDDSYGLWQINMIGSLGPARRAHFHLTSDAQLLDPKMNAAAMYSISIHGGNFSPWSTYTSGSYRKYLDADVSDVSNGDTNWLKKVWDGANDFGGAVNDGIRGAAGTAVDVATSTAKSF